MNKLGYSVVFATSEDNEFPASELEFHGTDTIGWQSAKYCDFPQDIIVDFGETCRILQVQILSHQSKISSRIELYSGTGEEFTAASFRRLGHLSLDSNERSGYKARELKSVFIEAASGRYFRLRLAKCHINGDNLFNQVGIVAINILGSALETATNIPFDTKKPAENRKTSQPLSSFTKQAKPAESMPVSDDRSIKRAEAITITTTNQQHQMNELPTSRYDARTFGILQQISSAKTRCVEREDYATAKSIKTVEATIKDLADKMADVEDRKRQAVANEDYDQATALKTEADVIRTEIEEKFCSLSLSSPIPVNSRATRDAINPHASQLPAHLDTIPSSRRREEKDSPRVDAAAGDGSSPMLNTSVASSNAHDDVAVGRGQPSTFQESQPSSPVADSSSSSSKPAASASRGRGRGKLAPGKEDAADVGGHNAEPERAKKAQAKQPSSSPKKSVVSINDDHPLSGVENISELPEPEEADKGEAKTADTASIRLLTDLFGDYRVRCLYSSTWALREAFLVKIGLMLMNDIGEISGQVAVRKLTQLQLGYSIVLQKTFNDKVTQVFHASIVLLKEILAQSLRLGTRCPDMDDVIETISNKLGDSQPRIRDSCKDVLLDMARSNAIDPSSIVRQLLKPLNKRQSASWKIIQARYMLLGDLAGEIGLSQSSGLGVDGIMNFVKSTNGFAHSNNEVRDSAKVLTVVLHGLVGSQVIMPHLKALRPKQLEEYQEAFAGAPQSQASARRYDDSNDAGETEQASRKAQAKKPAAGRRNDDDDDNDGKFKDVREKPSQNQAAAAAGDDDDDFTFCMFCGRSDDGWKENDLDMHYWKECSMLTSCKSCGQIVEIATLRNHLTAECSKKAEYVVDNTSGIVVKSNELASWRSHPKYRAPPSGKSLCPLCYSLVLDSEDGWRTHLTAECSSNQRRK